jgi:hypothetical protein
MEQVYFISHPRTGRIKIGFTRDLNTRLTTVGANLAEQVSLLGNLTGGRHLEQAIHHELRGWCIRGEWFRDCNEVRAFIDLMLRDGPEKGFGYVGSRPVQKKPKSNNFGRVARALWPKNTATNLAQRIGSSERGAQYLIDGERKVTARAIAVIVAEILD